MASPTDPISTIPAGTLKTAAEAGYTIKKLSSSNNTSFHLISGKLVVWQEGTGVTSKLQLFDGTNTKTLSTETSNVYKSYNSPAFVAASTHIDNGKIVWGQFVDELLAGNQVPVYHTFLYDGTNTTDLGKTTGAAFAGDRIAWATAGGINIYRISDKSNTLVPGAKDVTNLVIDGDKSIVWNENKLGSSFTGVADQTLKLYDGTKIVDLITLAAGKDAYNQPGQIRAAVSGHQVVYTKPGILNAPGELYLYNNGQSTKISDNVNPTLGFGINGDRVFYNVNNTGSSAERTYSISSGKIENPIEYNLSATTFGKGIFNPNTDGKNNTWISQETVFLNPATPFHQDDLYIDDGTTRVDLATSNPVLNRLESFVGTAISGSSVIYNVFTNYSDPTKAATIDLYLASKDNSPIIPVNNPPVVTAPVITSPVITTDPPVVTIPPINTVNTSPVITPTITSVLISGLTVAQNLLTTDATIKGFGVSAITQKPTNKVNEIGIFAVDDLTGKIGSLVPGSADYLKAVLDIAKPIFTTLAGDFLDKSNQEFSIDPNKIYQFFEIQDSSIADLKKQIASGKTPTNLLFSLPDTNGNSSIKVTNNSNNDGYKVSVNADELVLNVVKLAGAAVSSAIGSKSQYLPEGRTINLTDYAGQTLKADIVTNSSAAYTNNIGFYAVEDSIGTIKLANGSSLKPGDANYAVEAIKNALTNSLQAGKIDRKSGQDIIGGKIYAPVVVTQGTFNDFISKNPTNGGGVNDLHAYFNYLGANSDNVDHFRLIGNNTFGVEDMYGGGDRDFNDLVVKMNVKTA